MMKIIPTNRLIQILEKRSQEVKAARRLERKLEYIRKNGTASERCRIYKFKLTLEQVRKILSRAKCDICGSLDPKSRKGWHIDHSHFSNKVRGILCHSCNVFKLPVVEDAEFLSKALAYLKDPPGI